MTNRDLATEALAAVVHHLGWKPQHVSIEVSDIPNLLFLSNPSASRFGVVVDLNQAYEPAFLLVERESLSNKARCVELFKGGYRTAKDALKSIKEVNMNLRKGPVAIDCAA